MGEFIPVAVPCFMGNERKYVDDCIDTTWVSSNGKYVGAFEDAFKQYAGTQYAASCCNGTVALHLPLMALDLKEGDEVILPAFTYIATANAVRYCGAKPVFVDCLPDTWNIDPEDVKRKITPKTKGIMPVHLYGNPCDMDAVMAIAKEHGLFVLEDAAECHGAEYKGKKAGAIGDAGTFSFFGNKIITTGEGGMIVTNSTELDGKMRLLKGQGMDPKKRYWFHMVGYNYRMTNVEAAIGLAQLENIDKLIEARRNVAQWYMEELWREEKDGSLSFQKETEDAKTVWWMFSIALGKQCAIGRDALMDKLLADGIETRPLFYPLHIMPPYYEGEGKYPVSEDIALRGMNLPTHAALKREEITYICDRIKGYIR